MGALRDTVYLLAFDNAEGGDSVIHIAFCGNDVRMVLIRSDFR